MSRQSALIPRGPLALAFVFGALALCCIKPTPFEEDTLLRPAIITAEQWGSTPQPIPEERRHEPRDIVVHHAGVEWQAGRDPADFIRNMQAWGQRDKGWPDLPYHFMIAPNGQIYEARPVEYEGETNTDYDLEGHILVELMGNFETQRPSPNQIVSLVQMLAWLCQEHGCDPNEICGHCDVAPGQTVCPGRDLHRYIADGQLAQWVSAKLRGETPTIVIGAPLPDGPTETIPLD